MIVLVLFLALPAVADPNTLISKICLAAVSAVWVTSSAHFSAAGELAPMCEKKAAIWA